MTFKVISKGAMTYRRSSSSHEDQRAEVSSTLVGKSTSSVDQSTDTVCLDSRADNGATPRGGSSCGLLAVEVLLLGVGLLCAAVGIAEDGSKNGQGDGVVEGRAESNGRGLDGRKVYRTEGISNWPFVVTAEVVKHAAIAVFAAAGRQRRQCRCRTKSELTGEGGHFECGDVSGDGNVEQVMIYRVMAGVCEMPGRARVEVYVRWSAT
jgi:hypothetical protein